MVRVTRLPARCHRYFWETDAGVHLSIPESYACGERSDAIVDRAATAEIAARVESSAGFIGGLRNRPILSAG
jgi:hypothetical protein